MITIVVISIIVIIIILSVLLFSLSISFLLLIVLLLLLLLFLHPLWFFHLINIHPLLRPSFRPAAPASTSPSRRPLARTRECQGKEINIRLAALFRHFFLCLFHPRIRFFCKRSFSIFFSLSLYVVFMVWLFLFIGKWGCG